MTSAEFEALVAPHRSALHAHCYRMLASVADADDALQDALLGAWRGIDRFEGRSQLRSWLYTIATNACLALIAKRKPRQRAPEYGPPATTTEVGAMVMEPIWIEPYPDPHAQLEQRESIELAFIATLQHLPATQRAVLLLRDVLGFAADETATLLETSVAAANSALQRARETLAERGPAKSQQATLRELGEPAQQALVTAFVTAWESADVAGISALLARDAKFSMPPIPTWFDGAEAVVRFFAERVFETPWRLVPMRASGQLAFACYQAPAFGVGALCVVTVRDAKIAELTGFLDPSVHTRCSIPPRFLATDR